MLLAYVGSAVIYFRLIQTFRKLVVMDYQMDTHNLQDHRNAIKPYFPSNK